MKIEVKKHILFNFLILFLFLPLIKFNSDFRIFKPLKGSYTLAQKPDSLLKTWLSGKYQIAYNKYFEDHIGFRNFLVRINNQKHYSLYNNAKANGVIIGKENYLYEKAYIEAYYGDNFIGAKKIKNKIEKIKKIENQLKNYNTKFIIVLAPGKASFYPEYIPNKFKKEIGNTNYKIFRSEIIKSKINFIDFNKYFVDNKETFKNDYYPKTGIHWSDYSIRYVIDSIINKINSISSFNLPNIVATKNNIKTVNDSKTDMDIEKSMNLLFDIDKPKMKYFNITFKENKNKKPKVIVISDSFYWQIYNLGISKNEFNNSEFWYYYRQVYTPKNNTAVLINDINTIKRLKNADFVILLSTDANLNKFPWGFENTLSIKESVTKYEIDNLIKFIRTDEKWFESIKQKAIKNNIPIDSMLYLDAKYLLTHENK